jgi:hypothetical protein
VLIPCLRSPGMRRGPLCALSIAPAIELKQMTHDRSGLGIRPAPVPWLKPAIFPVPSSFFLPHSCRADSDLISVYSTQVPTLDLYQEACQVVFGRAKFTDSALTKRPASHASVYNFIP